MAVMVKPVPKPGALPLELYPERRENACHPFPFNDVGAKGFQDKGNWLLLSGSGGSWGPKGKELAAIVNWPLWPENIRKTALYA